jgi:pyruvate dehydrogenase E2 component (dihydrolipoamide acetyltransferase)
VSIKETFNDNIQNKGGCLDKKEAVEPEDSQVIAMSGIQKVMAITIAKSYSNIPSFHMSIEVDAAELQAMKKFLKGELPQIKVTLTPLLLKNVVQVLKGFPKLNASFVEGFQIKLHNHVNPGVAVSTERGLIVPVVKAAETKDIKTILIELNELIGRARAGRATRDDLKGGTFSISNAGMYGVRQFAAIINPPQAAILAVGAILNRPMARLGKIEIRPVMELTVSADHRLVDGATVAEFLGKLKTSLETPEILGRNLAIS